MSSPRWIRILQLTIVAFVALLLVGETLLYYPPARPTLSLDQKLRANANGTVTVDATWTTTFAAHLTLTDLIGNGSGSLSPVDFYYDSAYPAAQANPQDWFGLSQHLEAIAQARGIGLSLSILNAPQLAAFLIDPSTKGHVLIDVSGVLPDVVYGQGKNLLLPWIRSGGTLVWAGAPLGEYSGARLNPYNFPFQGIRIANGTDQFLPALWLGGTSGVYLSPSRNALALGVEYPYGLVPYAFNISRITAIGGTALGGVVNGFTNIARIPMGSGVVVDFAAPVLDVVRLSFSIFNLLQSGMTLPSYHTFSSTTFGLTAGESGTSAELVFLPTAATLNSTAEFCRFAFESDYLASFGSQVCLAI